MQPVSDFQLLAESSRENLAPFREFYRRHAAAVYDFAWRVLKSPGAAEDVVCETFREAFESAGMVVRPADVRSWLYRLAYRAVITRWESGLEPSDDPPPSPPALVPEDAEVSVDAETATLVWEAASGLDARHYALLDLDVRQDFDAGEIAVVTGQNRGQTVSLVARLERVVESAILSYIVARRGAAECDQLRIILGDARIPPFPPDLRALVDRHIEACDTCYALRQRVASPLETLAAFEPVAPPGPVLDALLARALGEAPPAETQPDAAEAPETAAAEEGPAPQEEPVAPWPIEAEAAEAAPALVAVPPAAVPDQDVFPAEGIEEEPEALVVRGTPVSAGEADRDDAAREQAGAPAAVPAPEEIAAEPEAAQEPAPGLAAAGEGAPPPGKPVPRWREWLERPWVSFGAGVAGGLVIIATVVAFMFASGDGGGAAETPTPSPTATPEPTEAPVIVPTATETPTPSPTDTPPPEPTEEPTATPTAPPPEPTATLAPEPTQPPASPSPATPGVTGTPATGTPAATPAP
jgi:DNA-directed RNA polymerase specialized sigma24 family protein